MSDAYQRSPKGQTFDAVVKTLRHCLSHQHPVSECLGSSPDAASEASFLIVLTLDGSSDGSSIGFLAAPWMT